MVFMSITYIMGIMNTTNIMGTITMGITTTTIMEVS